MIDKDNVIAICFDAAIVEYETSNTVLVNAEFDSKNNYWLVTFEVWEWFKCVWRVWERDDGTACYAFFKELSNK